MKKLTLGSLAGVVSVITGVVSLGGQGHSMIQAFQPVGELAMYKLAILVIFLLSSGYLIAVWVREYRRLKQWVNCSELERIGYHNLADFVLCMINKEKNKGSENV